MYNQNSQIIKESSNTVINDTRYDQDIIKSQILTYELIKDNPKDVEVTNDNPNNILERVINPNKDETVHLVDTYEEMRNKHRFITPKNHSISNVMGNVNEHVVRRRQSKLIR